MCYINMGISYNIHMFFLTVIYTWCTCKYFNKKSQSRKLNRIGEMRLKQKRGPDL